MENENTKRTYVFKFVTGIHVGDREEWQKAQTWHFTTTKRKKERIEHTVEPHMGGYRHFIIERFTLP